MIWKLQDGKYIHSITVDVTADDKNYIFRTAYNPLVIAEFKAMKGSKWNPKDKVWTAPICERNTYAIRYNKGYRPPPQEDIELFDLNKDLFKHQKEGINFILNVKRCMLAFEMGLGKTLTCIEAIRYIVEVIKPPTFCFWIVAPKGALKEWEIQLKRWNCPVRPAVMTTYESLHTYMDVIDHVPEFVIFDESVKIKNPHSQRSHIAGELSRLVRKNNGYIILLSGSPASKEPTDWWHQLECIFPGWIREGDVYKFRSRLANIVWEEGEFGKFPRVESWKTDEIKRLGRSLRPLVLTRKKSECLDLPDKIYDKIVIEKNDELLRVAKAIPDLCETALEALERLRELSDGFQYTKNSSTERGTTLLKNNPKIEIIRGLLDFYSLESGGIGRFVIYAAFTASIELLTACCREQGWEVLKIDGKGWSGDYEKFNAKDNINHVIVANPACIHGLNFTSTLALCYYSNSFSTDARIQSLDRRDRPGADKEKATRIIDIINLPTDQLILNRLNSNMKIQEITLQEIRNALTSVR